MYINKVLAVGAFAAVVAAIPLQQMEKRDVVWTTKVIEHVTTVTKTTTVWLNPGEATPKAKHVHHHHKPQVTSHIKSTTTVAPAPAETSTQSPYVAPSPTTPAAPDTPTTSAYTPPATSEASPPPAASPTASPAPSGGSGGGSAPSGQVYTGDITYYAPGLGSCGVTNSASDMIVAMAEDIMKAAQGAANSNNNPLCGKSITISYGGKTQVAKIEDTCPGCAAGSLDLTPSLFQKFAQESVGRVSGVKWWYN